MRTTRIASALVAASALTLGAASCSSSTPATSSASTTGSSAPASTNASSGAAASKFLDANGVDLQGTWRSTERHYRGLTEVGTGSEVLTITSQDGPLFVVSRDVTLDQPFPMGNGGPPTKSVTNQPALGVVNVDGSITIVKKGDGGELNGRLTDQNTMVLSYTEADDVPGVARVVLVRSAGGTTAGSTPGSTPASTSGTTPGTTPGSTPGTRTGRAG